MSAVQIEEWPDRGHLVHLAEPDRLAARLRSFIEHCRTSGHRPGAGHDRVMTATRMDELVDEHFRAEAAGDLQAIAEGFTADAEHDVAGRPGPPLRGGEQIQPFYRALLTDLEAARFAPVRRWYGEITGRATCSRALCLALCPIHHVRHRARPGTPLQASIAAGTLRTDLDAEDVILALAGLWQLDPTSDRRAKAERVYDIVLSGPQPST